MNASDVEMYPEIVFDVLEDYPSVRSDVDAYAALPPFDSTYRPEEVDIRFDECWVAGWNSSGRVDASNNLGLSPTAKIEVLEIRVDGQPGLILVLGVVVLNRIENIPGRDLWMV